MTLIFKSNDKKKFATDHICKKSLKNFQKKLPNSIIKKIVSKQKKNKIDVYELFNILKFISIGQQIRSYGLLLDDCYEKFQFYESLIKFLFELDLIEYSQNYVISKSFDLNSR